MGQTVAKAAAGISKQLRKNRRIGTARVTAIHMAHCCLELSIDSRNNSDVTRFRAVPLIRSYRWLCAAATQMQDSAASRDNITRVSIHRHVFHNSCLLDQNTLRKE